MFLPEELYDPQGHQQNVCDATEETAETRREVFYPVSLGEGCNTLEAICDLRAHEVDKTY